LSIDDGSLLGEPTTALAPTEPFSAGIASEELTLTQVERGLSKTLKELPFVLELRVFFAGKSVLCEESLLLGVFWKVTSLDVGKPSTRPLLNLAEGSLDVWRTLVPMLSIPARALDTAGELQVSLSRRATVSLVRAINLSTFCDNLSGALYSLKQRKHYT
jgi:hypothetical protein